MKKIYICGDSFGCPNLGWSIDPWPVKLQKILGQEFVVVNLSISCASNLLIRAQVDEAVDKSADYVILLATTCTRDQGKLKGQSRQIDTLYDRFRRIGEHDSEINTRDLACYSSHSLNESCVFDADDILILKEYHSRLFDLDLEIFKNQCIIESSLNTLEDHHIPFLFDQGGFENPMFGNTKNIKYFKKFNHCRSQINQWTIASQLPPSNKTHFHIVDQHTHDQIANYYYQNIVDFFNKVL
jgi:hypothetical protein